MNPTGLNPLSALIGGGASLIGAFMNTSSQQAINTANIQAQQQINAANLAQAKWSAQGGFLPGLVSSANAAGLSPLAVLGQKAPDMAVQIAPHAQAPSPGAGLQDVGRAFAQVDPYAQRQTELALRLGQANIEKVQAEASQAKTDAAKNAMILHTLNEGGDILNQIQGGLHRFSEDYKKFTSFGWRDAYDYFFGRSPQTRITIPRTPGN